VGNALGGALFFLIAPTTVAGVIPFLITRWQFAEPFFGVEPVRWPGAVFIAAGLVVIVDAFVRFVREGQGTPAPVAAPRRLVVRGPYRWVRNPMYVALIVMIAGQALVLGSAALLAYGAAIALIFHTFVRLYEEPRLRQQFLSEYEAYTTAVPRWLPRPPR
jgi:protein-S-isoprenylcysteine O-methyltransferase Ste14